MPILNLDSLTNASTLPQVLVFGRTVTVHPLTGSAAHAIAAAQDEKDGGAAMLGALLNVVASSCPDLTRDEVDRLSIEQISAIVQLSRGMVTDVEAMLVERQEKN